MQLTRTSQLPTFSPFDRLSSLRDEMDELFQTVLPVWNRDGGALFAGWSPSVDVYDDKDHIVVLVEAPGLRKEDIEINLQNGVLSISGERKRQVEDKELSRSERFFGKFHRTLSLPAEVDSSQVEASYRDGILTIRLAKAEAAKPRQIEISVD